MTVDGRRWWHATVDFTADSAKDAAELLAAITAQVYEADGVTDQEIEWIEGELVDGGEAAYVSLFLLPALCDVAQLIATAFDLTVGRRPSWIEFDEKMIHSDCGVMATELFRRHYDHNAELHDYVNNLEAN